MFSAILAVDDTAALLADVLFAPLARHVALALRRAGCTALCLPSALCAADPEAVLADDAAARAAFCEAHAGSPGVLITAPVFFSDTVAASFSACSEATRLLNEAGEPLGVCVSPDARDLLARTVWRDQVWFGTCRADTPLTRHTVHAAVRRATNARHIQNGVQFLDPDGVYIGPDVTIEPDTLLLPGTLLRGRTVIGARCVIGPNTMLTDCAVGDDSTVNASQAQDSQFGRRVQVGPFAYIRPGCTVGDDAKIGDFVELKNAGIGAGSKIPHLAYVGDATVGRRVNYSCGSITVNYDGRGKARVTIGDGVFVGCNVNLIAPVTVHDGAFIAAGTTVTEDVPANALAIGRSRQVNKEGYAKGRYKGADASQAIP